MKIRQKICLLDFSGILCEDILSKGSEDDCFFDFLKIFDQTQIIYVRIFLGTKLRGLDFLFHCFVFRDSFTAKTEVPLVPGTGFLYF